MAVINNKTFNHLYFDYFPDVPHLLKHFLGCTYKGKEF